jgi:hypothetical protein
LSQIKVIRESGNPANNMGKKTLIGALHMHTVLSHDGTMTLDFLADFLQNRGYDFIAVTEHSYDLDDRAIKTLEYEALRLSSNDFLIIPGIEYRCNFDIDILGFGVTKSCDAKDPETIIDHISDNGGVAVWAHPTIRDYPFDKKWIDRLHGYEIWNSANDGKYFPRSKAVAFYNKLRNWNSELKAFTGLDLHRKESFYKMSTVIQTNDLQKESILKMLETGEFLSKSKLCTIDSKGSSAAFYGACGTAARNFQSMARRLRLVS